MKILVTAGSTVIPIDKVRTISNIFKGRTGADISEYFHRAGHEVKLLTSGLDAYAVATEKYKTFDDLQELMKREITTGNYDMVIHSAAVSDYTVSRVCIPDGKGGVTPVDNSKKMSSSYDKMFLELVRTPKLVDLIREPWGFQGILVKFKLEVGKTDEELVQIATNSRLTSHANFIIANCLEWSNKYAYIIGDKLCKKILRGGIAPAIEGAIR